jgi:UDP-glucose 4-epimerase
VVYHLAAQSTVTGGVHDLDYTFATNVVGTFNVLRASAGHGIRRVVFASSREVYGEPISLPVHEEAPLLAINSYGATKTAGEALCRAFRRESGLDTVVLRLANVYGPRDTGRVIPEWTKRALAGEPLRIYGGKQIIDFVGVEQTVEAFARAAGADTALPPINIGSGTGTRIVELARRIIRLGSSHTRISMEPARPMDVTSFVANVDRMCQFLHIEPQLDPLHDLRKLFEVQVTLA